MESGLLNVARQYEKGRQWQKAIKYYEVFLRENESGIEDITYVSYAKCLRIIGNTKLAKRVLTEGLLLYPKSEQILLEFHNLYDYLGDWESAKK